MIPDTLTKDSILLQSREEETVVRRSRLKRGRSSARHNNSSMTHHPPSRLRRTKSLPSALTTTTYTGKPLFWFRATRQPPHQQSPLSIYKKSSSNHVVRPPRPLFRFWGAPMRKMRRGSSLQMPYLTAEEGRHDSFATAVTVMAEEDDDDDFDTTLIDYSDDEEDDEDFDDMEEEEVLRGLSFVDEQRE
jgi:hypothetical protein